MTSLSPLESFTLLGDDRDWALAPCLAWLLNEGRLADDPKALIGGLAAELESVGAPFSHLRFHFHTLHPELTGWRYSWSRVSGVEEFAAPHGIRETPSYIGSPLEYVYETGASLRRGLLDLQPDDHVAYHDYAAEGATDFVIIPLRFSDGSQNAFAAATDRAEGFRNSDILNLYTLAAHITPVLEVIAARRITSSLLKTYLGARSGDRVLRGLVKRGDSEVINAALWFSDLRDSTRLSETLSPGGIVELVNAYFELLTDEIGKRGGEVLRYVGDAMLVIFPADRESQVREACTNALEAARASLAATGPLNAERRKAGLPAISYGIGLHLGEVIYGNVGARNRLDFTVMGTEVNRAARIESLTKTLGVPMLMSSHFGVASGVRLRSMGQHQVKGVPYALEVFVPDDSG